MDKSKSGVPASPALFTFSLLVITLWGLATARPFLVPVALAALLAFLMTPFVDLMNRKLRLPEGLSLVLSVLILLFPVAGLGYLLVRQGQSLVQDFPAIIATLNGSFLKFTQTGLGHSLHLQDATDLNAVLDKVSSEATRGVALVVGGLAALLSAGSESALILIFGILMVASRKHLSECGEKILARNESVRGAHLLGQITGLIQKFLIARLLIVMIIGGLATLTLVIFGVKYAVILGGILGIMTLVPGVGFLIALTPTVIVTFAIGKPFGTVLAMVGVLVVLSVIEGNVLTPKMVGKKLNINALSSFLGLFAGGLLFGIWGMFLSVPILGVIRIVFSAFPSLQPWGDLLSENPGEAKGENLEKLQRSSA